MGRYALLVAAVAAALVLAACGDRGEQQSGGSAEPAEDVAVPKPGFSSVGELSIADFEAGSNNSYVQSRLQSVKRTAAELGASVEIFDATWDPTKQFNQMQTALTNKKYNAWLVQAVEPDPLCPVIEDAIAEGILVMVANQPLCGSETWTPGTVGFVGGQTLNTYRLWLKWIMEDNPKGRALLVTGPSEDANRRNLLKAYDDLKADYPDFEFVANQPTDYSTAAAYKVGQDVLLAKDEIDVVVSNYSGMTQGIVEAIDALGLKRDVAVYDFGGKVAKFVDLVRDPSLGELPILTRDNVGSYQAQFK